MLPPRKPIPIKERLSVLYVERCQLDVLDGAFVAIDVTGCVPRFRTAACWSQAFVCRTLRASWRRRQIPCWFGLAKQV
jgi:hypothetical protein